MGVTQVMEFFTSYRIYIYIKEIKVLAIEIGFYALYITNKTKHFYFKSERVMQVTEHYRKTRS